MNRISLSVGRLASLMGLMLCFVLAALLPFLQMRVFEQAADFAGWQVWLATFVIVQENGLPGFIVFPLLSLASLVSLALVIGLLVQKVKSPQRWRMFAACMLLAYLAAPFLLQRLMSDPVVFLAGYYCGALFHAGLLWQLWRHSA
ncbi:hypothetical protein ABHF33_04650 [Chitinibacter sp. FCG-7]|uniref:DUF4345 domain-containing protein n=1 Tax=Chitinibacter mangrovi TaxID=3153927 RepID=A0AAU7FD41_9NEIS